MLFDDQPPRHRKVYSCVVIQIGVALLILSGAISAGLWHYIDDRITEWWTSQPARWDQPSRSKLVEVSIAGTLLLLGGAFLIWIGVRELLACRSKRTDTN